MTTIMALRPVWPSFEFNLLRAGQKLGSLWFAPWREAATLRLDGQELAVTKRLGWGANEFRLESQGKTLATASNWWFGSSFQVEVDSYELKLRPWDDLRSFGVWRGNGCIGTIRSVSGINKDSTIELTDSLDVTVQLFLFALSRFPGTRWQVRIFGLMVGFMALIGVIDALF